MKKIFSILFLLFIVVLLPAEVSAENKNIFILDGIHVTATRTEKDIMHIPAALYNISSRELNNSKIVRSLPDAMEEVTGVMVQKTSYSQGSPFMRGLTGFRNLFLIDGIRLNNSVFRDGPNQYWNTVDPFSLEKIEIVKGPSSVLYGSDSVGGTINVFTIRPGNEKSSSPDGRVYTRYSTGEDSFIGRGEIRGRNKDLGWIIGYSYKDFGNLKGGDNVGTQPRTGYDEWDGDLKFEYTMNDDSKLVFAHQKVEQDDAWRTHKTVYGISWRGTTVGSDRELVYNQERNLTYIQYYGKKYGTFIDNIKLSFSYQEQKESQRRVRSDNRSDIQAFDAGTIGLWSQIDNKTRCGTLTYGLEYYHDDIDSYTDRYNSDGSFNSNEIQGPVADDATYDLLGLYIQYDTPLTDSFTLITGGRYTYAGIDAKKVKEPVTGERTAIEDDWDSIVASMRLLYNIDRDNHYIIFSGVSQGFRAPNLSDVTRLDTARSNEIETAAFGLKPEKYISYEVGFKSSFNHFSSQFVYFYTDIKNMIVRTPTGNIIDDAFEVTKRNSGDGYLNGIELNLSWQLSENIIAYGNFAWTYGEVDTYPTSSPILIREPVDKLMPVTYMAGIKWIPMESYSVELNMIRAEKQDKLSTTDIRDTQRIPPGGTPGYTVFNIRSCWDLNKSFTVSASLENLFNEDYRVHGSGLNEPGRNLIASMEYRF